MYEREELLADVGLRHIVEDGIAALLNRTMTDDRRVYVLNDLIDLFRRAAHGSKIARQQLLFGKSEERSAYECFARFDDLLRDRLTNRWEDVLDEVCDALERLRDGRDIPTRTRESAEHFLAALLSTIERNRDFGVGFEPEKVTLV